MDKEVLIALIVKDINELQIMSDGLAEMSDNAKPYFKLLLGKTRSLADNLQAVIDLSDERSEVKQEDDDARFVQRQVVDIEAIEAIVMGLEQRMEQRFAEAVESIKDSTRYQLPEQPDSDSHSASAQEAVICGTAECTVEISEAAEKQSQSDNEDDVPVTMDTEEFLLSAEPVSGRFETGDEDMSDRNIRTVEQTEISAVAESLAEDSEIAGLSMSAEFDVAVVQSDPSVVDCDLDSDQVSDSKPELLNEKFSAPETIVDKLFKQQDGSIAASINNHKIADLKSAITIADRFRFQRELFSGDGERMNKAISDLNSMNSVEEAENYIEKYFSWTPESQAAADFIRLLRRRYI